MFPVFCLCFSQCFLVVVLFLFSFSCFFSCVLFAVVPASAFEIGYIFVLNCFYVSCILPLFFPMFSSCCLFFSFSCFSLLFSSLLVPFSLLKRHIFLFLSFLYFVFVFPNVF